MKNNQEAAKGSIRDMLIKSLHDTITAFWKSGSKSEISTHHNLENNDYENVHVKKAKRGAGRVLSLFSCTDRLDEQGGGMPRMMRIQHPGALYHVIKRDNYKSDIFASDGAKNAFLKALGEAVRRYEWKLHAYVIMRNHYHLALDLNE